MKFKKNFLPIILFSVFYFNSFSSPYSAQQLIPAGHWLYDALFVLNGQQKRTSFASNAPVPYSEFKMYFDLVDYDALSDDAKSIYDKVEKYLDTKKTMFKAGDVFAAFNLNLNPYFSYKSNDDLEWSYSEDFTEHCNQVGNFSFDLTNSSPAVYRDNTNPGAHYSIKARNNGNLRDYGAASNYFASDATKGFVELPIYLGWGDYFFIETTPMFAKSFWGMKKNDSYVNIPFSNSDLEFLWPKNAYGSFGFASNFWGVNFNVNRQGLQIGKTQTGSIIYNSTFQTDGYVQLNLYSPRIKYNLDVVEISKNKNLYLHQIEARPYFNWIRLGIVEGMLIQAPFEMRFLNPIMIMHSFGPWDEYKTAEEDFYYDGEAHVCAYMGIQVEITPVKNFRMYFLYAQNEIQSEAEQENAGGKAMPDSLGGQLGFEVTVPDNGGWWLGTLEGIYTTPYLYVKQGAEWSLYHERFDMQSNGNAPICSWIGTPFGPDAAGFQTRFGYNKLNKWNAEIDYLFLAHGTNSFGLFNNEVEINGNTYSAYYPSVLRKMGFLSDEESARIARDYKLSGTVSFTNQIVLKGSYTFNEHFKVNGQFLYEYIINNKNISGNDSQGIELSLGCEYNLFK